MIHLSLGHGVLLTGAAAVAGAINSVAGGGTLLTFPALLQAGQTSKIANATSTVALWPGIVSSLWGYRSEMRQNIRAVVPLLLIGLVGGMVGALLLFQTPTTVFDRLVPFLILTATGLFMVQEPLSRWQKARIAAKTPAVPEAPNAATADVAAADKGEVLRLTPLVALFLFGVALYGGYFGAGIGILTLAALGLLGLTNIHQMNGLKNAFALTINAVAATLFVAKGLVDWRIAGIMAVGSVFGGYAGAGIARRIGQKNVRRVVIAIGVCLTLSLLWKQLRG